MSSSKKKLKKRDTHIVVRKKDLLAGIQALTIFYENKTRDFVLIRQDLGEDHAATQAVREEVTTLSNILNFLSDLVQEDPPQNTEFN